MAGVFITLEGGEGAGKSTLARALKAKLEADGLEVVLTREPGGTPLAEAVRSLILSPPDGAWPALSETLLFYAARVDHLAKLIAPALARDAWVISDRFSDSTRAYQTALDPSLAAPIQQLEALCVGDHRPDLTFVLDVPPDVARQRIGERGAASDAIDSRSADYHARVRRAFLDIAASEPQRCVVLDASVSAETLAAQAFQAIRDRHLVAGASR